MWKSIRSTKISSIVRPVLTHELCGRCGAGKVLRGEGYDVTREGEMSSRMEGGGMTLRGESALLINQLINYQSITNLDNLTN